MLGNVTFTQDRTVTLRKIFLEDKEYEYNKKRWYREAVKKIAEDMLSCRAVQVQRDYDLYEDRYVLTYLFREFRPERRLP